MSDPRNVAHDKRVQQEKKHKHEEIAPGAAHKVHPGKKPAMAPPTEVTVPDANADSADTSEGATKTD